MMMERYYEQWKKLEIKKNLSGEDAAKAVEQNGNALQYVPEEMFN